MGLSQHQALFHIIMIFAQDAKWGTASVHVVSRFSVPMGETVTWGSRTFDKEVILKDDTTEMLATSKLFNIYANEFGSKRFTHTDMKNKVSELAPFGGELLAELAHADMKSKFRNMPTLSTEGITEHRGLHNVMRNKISEQPPNVEEMKKDLYHDMKVFVSFLKQLISIKDTLNGILVFTSADNFDFAAISKLFNCVTCFMILGLFAILKENIFKHVRIATVNSSNRTEINGKHKRSELLTHKIPVFLLRLWNDVSTFFRTTSWMSYDKSIDLIYSNASAGKTKMSKYMLDFLYGIREVPDISISTYPASMDKYFDDLKRTDVTKSDLMKYEWARYESFKNFPKTSLQTPIRLAQAGFYYSGLGEEVTCFCCGKRNRNWNSEVTALQVHKRISPNCSFVLGEESSNVSIHASIPENNDTSHEHKVANNNNMHENGAANGGPGDTHFGVLETMTNAEQRQFRESTGTNTRQQNQTTGTPHGLEHNDTNSYSNNDTRQPPIPRHRSTGISLESARHPEYSVKTVRTSSYTGWAPHHVQTPDELSDAGFYYAGFQDCVRCFYCGGGLKNWEYGDSPWIEHARWYPNCDYLRQCKGEEFINQYREDKEAQVSDDTIGQQGNESASSRLTGETQRPGQIVDTYYTRNGDINSAAAEYVREMGYSTDTVKDAIEVYRTYHGNSKLTAEALMEIILDDASNRSNDTRHETSPNHVANDNTLERYTPGIESPEAPEVKHPNDRCRGEAGEATIPDISKMRITESQSRSTNHIPEKMQETDLNGKRQSTKTDHKTLVEENRSLREQMMCKICMDSDACIVFLPCGHMVACSECAPALRKCAICRKLIKGTIRAFPA